MGCPPLKKKLRTATSLWASQHVVLDLPLGGLDVQEHSICCTLPQKTQNIWHHMDPVYKTESFQHNDAHNYRQSN